MIALTDEQVEACLRSVHSCCMRVERDLEMGRYGSHGEIVRLELIYMRELADELRKLLKIEVGK